MAERAGQRAGRGSRRDRSRRLGARGRLPGAREVFRADYQTFTGQISGYELHPLHLLAYQFAEGAEPLTKLGHEPIGPNPRSILLAGGYLFPPALDDAGLCCWALQEDGTLEYRYHQPAIPAFNAAVVL